MRRPVRGRIYIPDILRCQWRTCTCQRGHKDHAVGDGGRLHGHASGALSSKSWVLEITEHLADVGDDGMTEVVGVNGAM